MENVRQSRIKFNAATICLIISTVLALIELLTVRAVVKHVYSAYGAEAPEGAMAISFIIFGLGVLLLFFILSRIKQGSMNAWLVLLLLSIAAGIYGLIKAKFDVLSAVQLVLTVLILVFSKQGLDAFVEERFIEENGNNVSFQENSQTPQEQSQNKDNSLKDELKNQMREELKKETDDESNN